MDHLSLLTSRDIKNNKSYHLLSDFVDADISGNFYFKDMIPSLSAFISNYLASFELNDSLINHHPSTNQQINYVIKLKKTDPVMEVFVPFLRVAPNTNLEGYYNEDEGMIALNGNSPDLPVMETIFQVGLLRPQAARRILIYRQAAKGFIFTGERKKILP